MDHTVATLKGKTIFITGASRGIGLAIALRAAADGANIVIAAKTVAPHPKLPGTIFTAAKEIEAAGGACLPLPVDIRHDDEVTAAVARAVEEFNGIDILINNASAIGLTGTLDTPMKRYDLMNDVNARGTYLCSRGCIPFLKKSRNPHILTMAPPLNLHPKWFAPHLAYTIAKYGMSMCVLGMAEEFRPDGIAVNALWPKTVIATAALQMNPYVEVKRCRTPRIMADAAYVVLTRDSKVTTGNFFIDEDVLRAEGVRDFAAYAVQHGQPLQADYFLN
jgi:citronellol/citronellal dehydrogenase